MRISWPPAALALAFAASLTAVPAAAGETTLAYKAVTHVTASHAAPVLGDDSHLIGIGTFRGLAIFDGGDVARHRYEGWFDTEAGTGRYEGYAIWRFDDGSEIRARYDGSVRSVAAEDFELEAKVHDLTGTGRFANATGEGHFTGRRYDAIPDGGTTFLSGTLTIRLPD